MSEIEKTVEEEEEEMDADELELLFARAPRPDGRLGYAEV